MTPKSVKGLKPVVAGLCMLPYSLGSSIASMPGKYYSMEIIDLPDWYVTAAWYISYRQKKKADTSGQKFIVCVGLSVATLGFGTFLLADQLVSRAYHA
jgi:hypothetical protein